MNAPGPGSESPQNTAEVSMTPGLNAPEPEIFKPVLDKEQKKQTAGSFISLVLFIIIGYFVWKSNMKAVVIITTVIFIHELGHLLAMKLFNYKDLNIFFIPLFGGAATGTKNIISQKQETIVLLSGPLPGIIIGAVLYLLYKNSLPDPWLYGFSLGFFLINLLNLLPIFPLDGGRILKIIFLNNSIILSNIFSALSIIAVIYFSLSQKDYLFLFFGFILLIGLINTIQKQKLIKILKEDGINLDTTYEELNKEQYTHIRQRILQTISAYKKYDLFDFDIRSGKEKLLAKEMEQIFKPAPVNDMKLHHKILITAVWAGCFAIPFMIGLPIPFING